VVTEKTMMNNKIYLLFFGLIFLASCGGGLSEKEKNEIENFEKEWDANLQMGDYLSEKISEAEKLIAVPNHHPDSFAVHPKMEEAVKYGPQIEKLTSEYSNLIVGLNKDFKNWSDFKNKAMKDELSNEEVKEEIEEQREKQQKIQSALSKKIKMIEKIIQEITS
jgi:hypothetical protein